MHRHFDEKLAELKEKLLRMSSLVEEAISDAIKSLAERKPELAEKVIQSDSVINMIEIEIDELSLQLLALHQPEAGDLRFVASIMKINGDLERMGDLAVNIAQCTARLLKVAPLKPLIDIPRMASAVQGMLNDSLNAFVRRDAQLAKSVCQRDDEVDNLNDQIFRDLLACMLADQKSIERAVELILVARHLERIADHSTNICEDVIYIVEGKSIKHHIADERSNDANNG